MPRAEISLPLCLDEPMATPQRRKTAKPIHDSGQRIEEWIVTILGDSGASTTKDDWEDVLGRIAPRKRAKKPKGMGNWARFRLVRRRGISIVELTDRSLIKEEELTELAGDLLALVEAGHHRIVLNFRGVERLSSWAVSFVAESLRRCARASQGTLKVCGLREEVAAIFAVTGSGREIAIYPDETAAVDSPWPHQSDLLPLPIDILSALTRAASIPFIDESACCVADDFDPRFSFSIEEPPVMIGVWLIPKAGSSKGRAIAVEGPRYVIGRDAECNLRPDAPAVSRVHSAIEIRDDQVFIRDLGSVNGTIHNGHTLRSEIAELHDGDQIALGTVAFTVALGTTNAQPAAMDDLVMTWLRDPDADDAIPLLQPPTDEFPTLTTTNGTLSFKHELIQDIVVLTPITADLDGDLAVKMLRTELQSLHERMLSPRVVVNLTHVAHLSARAIGILLAHHLKLDREGGALRVCQAHARVGAVLEQVHLGMIVECFPTLEDAVLEVWPKMVEETAV